MLSLAVWMMIVVFTGILADNKGRNVIGWMILSALFGIIPLIVLLLLPSIGGGRYR